MRKADAQREEQTRQEITNAAQKLFQKYGLDKTTMEEIAAASGKGKSSLYYYFPSKDDVFYAVARKEAQEVQNTIELAIKYQKDASSKLKACFLAHYHEVRLKMNLYPAMLEESAKHFELFRRIQRDNNTTELDLLKQIFMEGIKSGEFKSVSRQDVEALAFSILTMMRGLDSNIIVAGEIPSEEMRTDLPIDIFIRGLC